MRKLENSELNRISVDDFKEASKTPLIIVLDDIRSLNNIGSVFRTSDAFLVEKIFLCGITAIPPNKEIHKTALGATETVAWEHSENVLEVIEKLKSEGTKVYAIEQVEGSIFLQDFEIEKNQKYALIFGNEVFNVSQKAVEICDRTIKSIKLGTKHSHKISISTKNVNYKLLKKMR
jgi:tRNA G18 (ribose-2'-O)-methylase SpoU